MLWRARSSVGGKFCIGFERCVSFWITPSSASLFGILHRANPSLTCSIMRSVFCEGFARTVIIIDYTACQLSGLHPPQRSLFGILHRANKSLMVQHHGKFIL